MTPTWDDNKAIASHFTSADEAVDRFGAVGLNTVPAWLRPYQALSTGQQFRANVARQLRDGAVIDEFTSVVDRTVAKAASVSLRRYVTMRDLKRITLATCHYDVIEWLQPDWIFDCGSGQLEIPRGLLRRPSIDIAIHECGREIWPLFAPHHYLSSELLGNSLCFAAFYDERLMGFSAVAPFPHGAMTNAVREHRTVILPDFQGLGVGPRLSDAVAEHFHCQGYRFYSRTAHPRLSAYRMRSPLWETTWASGKTFTGISELRRLGHKFTEKDNNANAGVGGVLINRVAASFVYVGNGKSNDIDKKDNTSQLSLFAKDIA